MKRLLSVLAAVLFSFAVAGSANAGAGPKTIVLKAPMGNVTFNHWAHQKKVKSCTKCHHKGMQKCSKCHNSSNKSMPEAFNSMKKVCHKACIGCHKKMGGPTSCMKCHKRK